MSDTIKDILERRSYRSYKPDMVEKEVIEKIVEAGLYAPSGKNNQPGLIVAVTNKEMRDRISAINAKVMGKDESFDPFFGAPVVLIVLADKTKSTYVCDGSLMIGNMMLAAHSLGVASCWIHRAKEEFETEEGKQILADLGIGEEYEGIGHCILGYAACDAPKAAPRKENRVYWLE